MKTLNLLFADAADGLLLAYSCGDQKGHEFISTATAKATAREFCESFFD